MKKTATILISTLALAGVSLQASATNHEDLFGIPKDWVEEVDPHAGHNMGGMSTPTKDQAEAGGVLHKIDAANRIVNITHDPIPDLGWPGMTMDLVTTKRVKLNKFKIGDKVSFTIKRGRDNVYRITKMKTQ